MKIAGLLPALLLAILSGCGGTFMSNDTGSTTSTTSLEPGESELGARIIFHQDNFTDINDFNPNVNTSLSTSHTCLGDVTRVFYVDGDDYMGSPTALPTPSSSSDTLLPTNRPAFISNVSVDITNTYFPLIENDILLSDVCSKRSDASAPAPSSCADFDRTPDDPTAAPTPLPTVAPTATPSPMPSPSATPTSTPIFGTNYYRVVDEWCTSQGPTVSPDPELTKAGVGGVSIDLDRTQLGANEDLLMMVTYHALNENSTQLNWPGLVAANTFDYSEVDRTIMKVNLVGTQQSLDALLGVTQPRPWAYSNTNTYPIYVKEIATLSDPFGTLRTEQIYIPLSQNAMIDRIRIERVRGSFHLYQVDLYRLGNRAE